MYWFISPLPSLTNQIQIYDMLQAEKLFHLDNKDICSQFNSKDAWLWSA